MSIAHYFLGCPIWGRKDWVGLLFPPKTRAASFLRRYAEIFNAVEGNTTFYGVPKESAVARWCEDAPPHFRFCFKFPRVISHDKRLRHAGDETRAFVDALAPLGERLGPRFLQLPPSFAPPDLPVLDAYLETLPAAPEGYALEVRHAAFYEDTPARARLDDMLRARAIDRVLLDTRGLHAADARDPDLRETQRQKPAVPLHLATTAQRPFVRLIGHPDVDRNRDIAIGWAEQISAWLDEGKEPYVFAHMSNDYHAPALARMLHDELSQRAAVGILPSWPLPPERPSAPQLALF
ncbi:DUF72 domain-containing protein [Haliangium ochraceum]|uniref:DUF72 domain-containing protein n=1 Tax=Haliangium ochraceum (strain DSM 14365 / JCM 11303 / SMP-2) TaxID=502025 RepID=D0LFS1_HALO1|nr:DUF72 domain-containing protein [Haliangium ochraceum]ACY14523.1 protein of unknown function DUF72 [Haliangium ochraceum DSM 14365]